MLPDISELDIFRKLNPFPSTNPNRIMIFSWHRIKTLENDMESLNSEEDSAKRSEIANTLLYQKYARFCAVKAVKLNMEELLKSNKDDPSYREQINEITAMYNDFMVPPIR